MKKLVVWKNNESRKPLILKGARQVGKIYILKKFLYQVVKEVAREGNIKEP